LKFWEEIPAAAMNQKTERRQIGTESVKAEVVEAVKTKAVDAAKEPVKKITMQVKPNLLYAPALFKTTANPPDKTADFQLFDRVVVAKESEKHAVGDRGTVIGVNRVKDLNPVRQ
jgi:5'-3' exoribonuclease 1